MVMMPRIFNALPLKIKQIECDNEFIKTVNKFFRERQFYDMHEYFRVPDIYIFLNCIYSLIVTYFKGHNCTCTST
jgi:hypothetical protein